MFGYVRAYKPMLRVCELEAYKSVYCGLCKELGKRFGLWARFTLSYDFTFLALLAMSMESDEPTITPCRCTFNPLHRASCCHSNDSLAFAADMAILMLWHKVEDNIADEGVIKRTSARIMRMGMKKAYSDAVLRHGGLAKVFATAMQEQQELERASCDELDRVCHPTATMLGSVLGSLGRDEPQQRVLQRMGYLLGRYVYLSDALDDMEKDEQDGSYNPLLLTGDSVLVGESRRDSARGSLYMTIAEVGTAYELLELTRFAPILDNIIYMGLRENVNAIHLPHDQRPRQSKF